MIPLDILRDVLANVANPGPWSVADHHNYRHVVNADGNIIADDVGDDAPLIAAAPDLARDVLSLADALATAQRERDTARSALDELVAAVATVRDARAVVVAMGAQYNAAWDAANAPPTASQSEGIAVALRASYEAGDALSAALNALLSAAPAPTTVDARVVREYLRAEANCAEGDRASGEAMLAARAAVEAALAGCV